jgi:regulator of sirC expression with transglutaminase-like and TPR domain
VKVVMATSIPLPLHSVNLPGTLLIWMKKQPEVLNLFLCAVF